LLTRLLCLCDVFVGLVTLLILSFELERAISGLLPGKASSPNRGREEGHERRLMVRSRVGDEARDGRLGDLFPEEKGPSATQRTAAE